MPRSLARALALAVSAAALAPVKKDD